MLGPDLLIAPSPWPEQLDSYLAEFPALDWYDYWTGKRVLQSANGSKEPLTLKLHPELASLPVFVRGGAILPIEPLVQSTNETPHGPLTLRVYYGGAGNQCAGSLYSDDGKSYAYRDGDFLRMQFACKVDSDGFHLHLSSHEGTYPAWWKEISAEVYGWKPTTKRVSLNGRVAGQADLKTLPHGIEVTFADDGKGGDLLIQ